MPHHCYQFEGVFNTMVNDKNSECGALDGEWCAYGNGFTSGEMREGRKRIYYGFCAKRK